MKKLIITAIIFCLILSLGGAAVAATSIYLNGDRLNLPQEPLIVEGTTLVPMRPIFEALGAKVTWNSLHNEVEVEKASVNIKLPIGKKIAIKNGYMEELQTATKIVNGTSLVPLRFVSESLGAEVEWNKESEIITINTQTDKSDEEKGKLPELLSPTEIAKQAKYVVLLKTLDKDENLTATGSGVVIGPGGLLATNYHVIKGAVSAQIVNDREEVFEVEGVLAFDQERDLAILKVKADLPYTNLADSEKVEIGEQVYSIGSPLGIKNTVSNGMVSNLIEIDGQPFIQTTAPISQGSSGGGLFNAQGQLIGITTATISKGQGLNYAIPINVLKDLASNLAGEPTPLAVLFAANSSFELITSQDKLVSYLNEYHSDFVDGINSINFSYHISARGLYDYEIDAFLDPAAYGNWLETDNQDKLALIGGILKEVDANVDLANSFRVVFFYQELWSYYPSFFAEDEISPGPDGKGWLVTQVIANGYTIGDEIKWEVY